jgi:hypothetical protein
MSTKHRRKTEPPRERPGRENGRPGGGQGRIDEVGRTGVYPGSGPYPPGDAEVRTPGSLVHGQRDAEGREEEGGSEPTYFNQETLLGGPTPAPSGKPTGDKSSPGAAR